MNKQGGAGVEVSECPMELRPEGRLMLAVLEDAISVFQRGWNSPVAKQRQAAAEADRWFASNDEEWPASFVNVCGYLSLDPDYIRGGIQRFKRKAHEGKVVKIATRRSRPQGKGHPKQKIRSYKTRQSGERLKKAS